ncbi:unnamed protein product [Penicillium camemberti]|uniref:Str. FM013 n=1 Tax=Penicillium camemberti (strain FM 013) TaxID=1429867 RepID=A0A0G4P8V9_PENC3|nr:unnamed protein product [Penicillium camemberti]
MAAWTRFKLLLAMVTTLVAMVAASAECHDIETVFLQDPHTGEQYQFGQVNILPRALFGRAVHASELITVTVTHTTCGHEEPTTTVTTDVPCTTELSTTPLTMESTTPVPAQVTTPVTGVSQSTVPTTSSIPVPVTSQISVSSTPEVSSQSTAPVSSQTPVPVTTTQTPVSSIPEVTTQRATEAMGLERSCRLPLEAFMPL